MPLQDRDMPALFVAADAASKRGQRRYVRATAARLVLAVVAAVFGALAALTDGRGVDPLGLAAALCFTAALTIEIWLLAVRPEHSWYDGRALAESAKTMTWRYAVGGAPFGLGVRQPETLLAGNLADLLRDSATTEITPAVGGAVSPAMARLRSSDLSTRIRTYRAARVQEQQSWYAGKAQANDRRSSVWKLLLIALEVAGVLAGTVTALGYASLDLTSVISTCLGCGVAWLAVKQHDSLSRSYALASHELVLISAMLSAVEDEQTWATAVADAEEAISREHTMWRASRAVDAPRPRPRARPVHD